MTPTRSPRAALIRLTYATVASRSCDHVGVEPRDEFAGVVRRRRRAAAARQQIGRDRHEAVLGELLRGLADEVRHPEDLVDHHDDGRRILALGIGEVGGDRIPTAWEFYVFGVNVSGRRSV